MEFQKTMIMAAALFATTLAWASGSTNEREIGAVTCVYQTGEASQSCLSQEGQNAFSCMQNASDRKLINKFIMAPQMCIDSPMMCEGGPLNSFFEERRRMDDARLKLSYSEGMKLTLRVGETVVQQETILTEKVEDSARVAGLDGLTESLEIQTQVGTKLYHVVCHAFTATMEEIKNHSRSDLKKKLKTHFFKSK